MNGEANSSNRMKGFFKNQDLTAWAPIITLIILVVLVGVMNPRFLSTPNLMNMLSQWAAPGIVAAGITFVALTGGFDLSVAAAFSFTAVVAVIFGQHVDPVFAFAAAITAGILFGIFNGFLIAFLKLNPYIATVGSGFMLNGLALLVTDNAAISVEHPDYGWLGVARVYGVPISGILLIITVVVLEFVLKRTPYGQSIYAVGGNPEASWLSGISTRLVTGSAYVIFGACVGVGGCITSSQLQAAQAGLDPGMIFDVLTIIVVGGTSLSGGTGAVWRTAVGLAIIATMSNGFIMLGISPYYQDLIKGAIIILALTMSAVAARKG